MPSRSPTTCRDRSNWTSSLTVGATRVKCFHPFWKNWPTTPRSSPEVVGRWTLLLLTPMHNSNWVRGTRWVRVLPLTTQFRDVSSPVRSDRYPPLSPSEMANRLTSSLVLWMSMVSDPFWKGYRLHRCYRFAKWNAAHQEALSRCAYSPFWTPYRQPRFVRTYAYCIKTGYYPSYVKAFRYKTQIPDAKRHK
jgi:hypothetical protein